MGRPARDFTGYVIGALTVERRIGSDVVHGKMQPIWLCRCACGNEKILSSNQLRQGSTRSCGCITADLQREYIEDKTVGKRFGKLIVLSYAGNGQWTCECDCGRIVDISRHVLRSHILPSCGCASSLVASESRRKDETGNKYGELLVLSYDKSLGEAYWLCECSCGNITSVRGSHLRNGTVQRCKDCGIRHAAKTRETHGLTGTKLYKNWLNRRRRQRSKMYDSEWTPEMEVFLRRLFPQCVLCGMSEREHQEKFGTSLHVDHVRPLVNGNGLGPGNATILCAECNRTKWSHTLKELDGSIRDRILVSADLFDILWSGAYH